MHSEDESRLILSKWPFYLGDALLVSAALAIAILSDWQLSDWQVAACVTAVALGAALLVLPFIVEFYMRGQELKDDRSFEMRHLVKRIEAIEVQFNDVVEQLEGIVRQPVEESTSQKALVEAVDRKFKMVDGFGSDLEKIKKELRSELKAVKQSLTEKDYSADMAALSSRLDTFENKLKEAATKKIEQVAPKRIPRKKRQSNSPLINRAIKVEKAQTAAAVERIIQPKAKSEKPPVGQGEAKVEKVARVKGENNDASVEKSPGTEPVKEKSRPEKIAENPVVAKKKDPEDESLDLEAEVPLINTSDMLFDDVPIKTRARKSRTKKVDTVVTVNALIGIGNKPFIRGSGGGLNWEKGVPMEFQEIGKWRWLAPVELEEAIEIEIYRNDEDLDQSGRHRVDSGQKFEITPVFP
ncbi:MAG: hypothetical protein AAGH40_12995 [Verrucomicrobiota bacterium]